MSLPTNAHAPTHKTRHTREERRAMSAALQSLGMNRKQARDAVWGRTDMPMMQRKPRRFATALKRVGEAMSHGR